MFDFIPLDVNWMHAISKLAIQDTVSEYLVSEVKNLKKQEDWRKCLEILSNSQSRNSLS